MACIRFGDCHCFIAAALLMLCSILRVYQKLSYSRELRDYDVDDKKYYNDLQPLQLAATWSIRVDQARLETFTILVSSFAWMFLAIVLIKLAWAISARGTKEIGSSATIAVLAITGSLAELLSNLFYLGTNKAMRFIIESYELNNWISLGGSAFDNPDRRFLQADSTPADAEPNEPEGTGEEPDPADDDPSDDDYTPEGFEAFGGTFEEWEKYGKQNNFDFETVQEETDEEFVIDGDQSNTDYNEDGLGWKTLEVAYATSKGMINLVDSVEFVLLAAIMVTIFLAVRRGAAFSKAWSYLGLVMALLSVIQFFMALASNDEFDVRNVIATYLMLFSHVFLLPIWLIWLGFQMKDATESEIETTSSVKGADHDDSGFPSSFN